MCGDCLGITCCSDHCLGWDSIRCHVYNSGGVLGVVLSKISFLYLLAKW